MTSSAKSYNIQRKQLRLKKCWLIGLKRWWKFHKYFLILWFQTRSIHCVSHRHNVAKNIHWPLLVKPVLCRLDDAGSGFWFPERARNFSLS